MSRRYLALWLPYFATDRLGTAAGPLVTLAEQAGVPRVMATNIPAAALGIVPGRGDTRRTRCAKAGTWPSWPIGAAATAPWWRWMARTG